jgi:hypothetical protein
VTHRPPFAVAAALALLLACRQGASTSRAVASDPSAVDTVPVDPATVSGDSAVRRRHLTRPAASGPARLSALADTIGTYLVFAPLGETSFTVSSRNRKSFVDIGRVDTEVRRDSARSAAFREAVTKRSTVPPGSHFRVHGSWGAEDVTGVAVDTWNGRIVLRLSGSPRMDTLARSKTPMIAAAFLTDTAAPPVADSCDRSTPLSAELQARLAQLRDSLSQELRAGPQPPYERLRRSTGLTSSQVTGCFGPARVALVVSLKAGNVEWVRERVVIVDTLGRPTPLRVSDYRFRAHEFLAAFDADGDGIDDLATRATTQRAGGTTVLRLDLKAKRLTRLTAGFAWEEQ